MGFQGPLSGATFDGASGLGGTAWSNPTNAASSNNSYATAVFSGSTKGLKATNFGFSIPAGATITGIYAEVERRESDQVGVKDQRVRIVKGGVVGATDKADTVTNWPASDAIKSYGSSSDLWGETWTAGDINASTFGVEIAASSVSNVGAEIDHIRITVYYNLAPNAPVLDAVASFNAVDAKEVTHTFSDPDAGDTQSAYQMIVERVSDSVVVLDTTKTTSAAGAHTIAGGTLANGQTYRRKVRTWDQGDLVGVYSSFQTFETSTPPTVTIDLPATDGAVIAASSYFTAWTPSEQSAYRVVVKNDAGVEQSSTGKVTSADTGTHEITGLPNGAVDWSIEVVVWNDIDVPSTTAVRTFDVVYTAPPVPGVTVTAEDGYLGVAISNPTPGGGEPAVTSNDLYRREQGGATWMRIAAALGPGGSYRDYVTASGQVYEYRVNAIADDLTSTFSAAASGSLTLIGIWLHDPTDAEVSVRSFRETARNKQRSRTRTRQKAFHNFAGRDLPVADIGEQLAIGVAVTLHIYDDETMQALRDLDERDSTLCYRDSRGRRHFGLIDSLPEKDEMFGYSVSFDFVATDHSEAV